MVLLLLWSMCRNVRRAALATKLAVRTFPLQRLYQPDVVHEASGMLSRCWPVHLHLPCREPCTYAHRGRMPKVCGQRSPNYARLVAGSGLDGRLLWGGWLLRWRGAKRRLEPLFRFLAERG